MSGASRNTFGTVITDTPARAAMSFRRTMGGRSPKSKVQSPKSKSQGPRSRVHGPKSRKGCPSSLGSWLVSLFEFRTSKFGASQIVHQPGNDSAGFRAHAIQFLEFGSEEVALVQGDVQLGPDLPARTLGGSEELSKFFVATAFKSFSNVRRDRHGSRLDLFPQVEVFRKRTHLG